ncbi:Fanconi anemia core complex-associated protein 100 [Gastrophryne carolinensis]
MASTEQLAQLWCPLSGFSAENCRLLSWRSDVYVSTGGRHLHVFNLERKLITAVYLFASNIWHMELDASTRQLYVLCQVYGIYLLEWDESGRLVMEPSSTSQIGNVTLYHIGPSFVCLSDPSVRSFTLAPDVLVPALLQRQPCKWRVRLFHRKSLRYEDLDAAPLAEVKTSAQTDAGKHPVLRCVSLKKENKTSRVSSDFALEAALFTKLFGVDAAILDSPMILCGFPDGQVVYFPLKRSGSSCSPQSRVKILYRLEQPVVSIGAAKMAPGGEQPIGGLEQDCLLLIGQKGRLVSVTSGEERDGASCDFREDRLQAPVLSAFYSPSGVFYSAPSNLLCITVSRGKDQPAPSVSGRPAVSSTRHNVPMIAAAMQNGLTADGTELVLLSSRGRLMLYKFNQKGSEDQHHGLESGNTGQRIKELLSGIGSVSDRVSRLKSAMDEKNRSLLKLNRVMTLSRQLLSGPCEERPVPCTVTASRPREECPVPCTMTATWSHMLQSERILVSCSLENRTDCILDHGWTLCLLIHSHPGASYSFPLAPLKPGERTEITFPLPRPCRTEDFPIKITSTLFYDLKALSSEASAFPGISLPLREHSVDLLQCLRLGPRTHLSPSEDVVRDFIKASFKGEACRGALTSMPESAEPLKVTVHVSTAALAQALQTEKSGKSLCLATLQFLLSSEIKEPSTLEVQGWTTDGYDFLLRLQEISVSDLAAGGSFPAIEVQILSSSLSAVASLHSAVLSRLQILLQESNAPRGDHPTPDLDLGKIQQRFRALEPLLKELKSVRERLCLDDDIITGAAAQKLLRIYRELRDSALLFI